MARINIEDSLFVDARFFDLAHKLGSLETALGSITYAWIVAQKWFLKSESGGIPLEVWNNQRLRKEIIDVGLAEYIKDSVYLKGTKEQFAWLTQASNAGKKSAEVRSTFVDGGSTALKVSQPLPLSLSPSPSLSQSPVLSQKEKKAPTCKQIVADAPLPDELSSAHGFLIERKAKGTLVRGWLEIFPEPDWILGELRKAHIWEEANPRKKKKDFGKFMTNWLTRGWDSRKIQSAPFNRAEQRTQNNRAAAEQYMKKLEEEKV